MVVPFSIQKLLSGGGICPPPHPHGLRSPQTPSPNRVKYFNGTIISTSFSLPAAGVFTVIFILYSNDQESVKLSFGSSL